MSSTRTPAFHIDHIRSFPIIINGFTTSAGSSDSIATILGTALNTAGRGGKALPNVASGGEEQVGYINIGEYANVNITSATDGQDILTSNNEEVYGRLNGTNLEYYYKEDGTGTETAYTFPAPTDIKFNVNYRAQISDTPADAGIAVQQKQLSNFPGGVSPTVFREDIGVTAVNTFGAITKDIYDLSQFYLVIDGITYESGAGMPVVISSATAGTTPTWNPAVFPTNQQFDIPVTSCAIAVYPTIQ